MTKVVLGGIVHQTKQVKTALDENMATSVLSWAGVKWISQADNGALYIFFKIAPGAGNYQTIADSLNQATGGDPVYTVMGSNVPDTLIAIPNLGKAIKQEALTPLDPSALQWLMQLRNGAITVSPSDSGLAALDALTRTPYASEIAGTNNLEEMGYRTFQITEAGIEYLQENGKMQKQGGLSPVQISLMQQIANYSIGSWQASANYSDLSYLLQMGFLTGAISAPDTLQLTKSGYDALEANDAGLDNNPYDAAAARQIAGKQTKGLSQSAQDLWSYLMQNAGDKQDVHDPSMIPAFDELVQAGLMRPDFSRAGVISYDFTDYGLRVLTGRENPMEGLWKGKAKQQKGFMGLSPAAEALLQRMHHNFFEAGNYDYLIPVGFSPDEQAIYELTGRGWARFVEMDEDNQAKAYQLTNEGIAAAEQSLGISKQQKQGGDSVDLILRASTALNGIICVDLNTPDQDAAEELVRWGTFTRYTSIPGNAEDLSDSSMCYQITPRALRNVTEGNFPGIKQQKSIPLSRDEYYALSNARGNGFYQTVSGNYTWDIADKLQQMGLLSLEREESESNGWSRRTYLLTPAGEAALNEAEKQRKYVDLTPEETAAFEKVGRGAMFNNDDPILAVCVSLQAKGLVNLNNLAADETGYVVVVSLTNAGLDLYNQSFKQRSSLDELKAALEAKAEALTDDSPLYLTEKGEAELKKIQALKDYELSPDAVDLLLSFSDRDSLKDLMDSMYRSRLFDQLRDAGLIEPYGVNVDPYRRTFFLTPAGVAAQNEYMGASKSTKFVTKVLLGGIVHEIPEKAAKPPVQKYTPIPGNYSWQDDLDILAHKLDGDAVEALNDVYVIVSRLCKSNTSNLLHWLANLDYGGTESPSELANAWDRSSALATDQGMFSPYG